jgi:hypothetical protein
MNFKANILCSFMIASLTNYVQQKQLFLEPRLYLGTDAEGVFAEPAVALGIS